MRPLKYFSQVPYNVNTHTHTLYIAMLKHTQMKTTHNTF